MSENIIKTYRKKKGLTQAKFGAMFGVKDAAVCKWEKGRVTPARAVSISEITGIPPHKLRPDIFPEPDLPARDINEDAVDAG